MRPTASGRRRNRHTGTEPDLCAITTVPDKLIAPGMAPAQRLADGGYPMQSINRVR
jgi:hypothetical protein